MISHNLWHYVKDNQQAGPVTSETMCALIDEGAVNGDTLVWTEGMPDWLALNKIDEFKDVLPPPRTGLKLQGQAKAMEMVNVAPETEGYVASAADIGGHDIRSLLQENVAAVKEDASEEISGFWPWFFSNSFELNAFWAMLLLSVVGIGAVYITVPEFTSLSIFASGFIIWLVGGITFRVRTFQASIVWGVLGLVSGISDLFFVVLHWGRSWRPILLSLAGMAIIAVSLALMSASGDLDDRFWQEVWEDIQEEIDG